MDNSTEKNDKNENPVFDLNLSMLPMNLQMFAMSLNMSGMKLFTVRGARTRLTVEVAQAIIDKDSEAVQKQYGRMFSTKTINGEWTKLEEIKAEIDTALTENMPKFEAADKALKKAGKTGVDYSLLRLPEDKLADVRKEDDTDKIYDSMSEYNSILSDFLYQLVQYCGELGMSLLRNKY